MGKRDLWVEAIEARLDRVDIDTEQGLAPVLEPDALKEARQLAGILRDDDGDLESRYVLGWLHMYRYWALPDAEGSQEALAALDWFTDCFVAHIDGLPEVLLPHLAQRAGPIAVALLREAARDRSPETVEPALRLWERMLRALPSDHEDSSRVLNNLGLLLRFRYDYTEAEADLDRAIDAAEEATRTSPLDRPERPGYFSNLGAVLEARFERTGVRGDLDAAVRASAAAVDMTPVGDPDRPMYLTNLGSTLRRRFEAGHDPADVDRAVEATATAVELAPDRHPDRPTMLSNLGNALRSRFDWTRDPADLRAAVAAYEEAVTASGPELAGRRDALIGQGLALHSAYRHFGERQDLDAAVATLRAALALPPGDDATRAAHLSFLGQTLDDRYDRLGDSADADGAVAAFEQALVSTPPDRPEWAGYASSLVGVLRVRYDRTGRAEDLARAADLGRAVLTATPPGHPERAGNLSVLGVVLLAGYIRSGDVADLDAAVAHTRAAVEAASPDDQERYRWLSNLGITLRARFERTGDRADLDAAIAAGRGALEACTGSHTERRVVLSALGGALRSRYHQTGSSADLDEAVEVLRAAVRDTPEELPELASELSNLGGALQARYARTFDRADLDEAVDVLQTAVRKSPDGHSAMAMYFSNLGGVLHTRFTLDGEQTDLDAAISALGAAVRRAPAGHTDLAMFSSNLAVALQEQFSRTARTADLDAAVDAARTAVRTTPVSHTRRALYLFILGHNLLTRHRVGGDQADLDEAVTVHVEAVGIESAPPSVRIEAARAAADLLASPRPAEAADLLEAAVRLMPRVAPRQLSRADQQYGIGGLAGLAADAAALALSAPGAGPGERAERALGLLEAGRAVLLSQALDTRSDLSDLNERHPGLASRFTHLRDMLDPPAHDIAPQADADRGRLADEFTELLEEIRALDGFASFALPPKGEDLLREAHAGPVAVFNVSTYGSHALLVTADGVVPLELPSLAPASVSEQTTLFQQALGTAADPAVTFAERQAAQARLNGVLEWLWDAATGPVLDTLGITGAHPSANSAWPRVWWVPGGQLAMLPLHAAGHRTDPPGDVPRTVLDRVVSSYVPTVRALHHARRKAAATVSAHRSLIVAMPTTPGIAGRLAHVPTEAEALCALLPVPTLLTAPDNGEPSTHRLPTRANVLAQLPDCSISHFACHGASHPGDPSKSLLLLHDHATAPLTVASLAPVRLDHARLAYLSACGTASTAAAELADEAIHLTSAFQLAGFPHVIGTLWKINDAVAVDIAERFYTGLYTDDAELDTGRAARALHDALRAARSRLPRTPSLWAAHIHAGA
ncbi:CHAT domain-containing protein [Streptomyces sp. NPDC006458]|uniref:CHAT domain-containing protein n=1 Tax=Streptomyces sp. NPDC006458 TaxID=3154302 RepID=UPI0033AC9B5D